MKIAGALAVTFGLLVACSGGDDGTEGDTAPEPTQTAVSWPRPTGTAELAREAGLELYPVEHLDYHVHAQLEVFVDGQQVDVPAAIGIVIEDPGVKEFEGELGTGYGGIDPEEGCENPCISPLHTHDPDGVIHTESPIAEPNTLGQFFIEWGVTLDAECVADFCSPETPIEVSVDGEPYEGNPAEIELVDGRQISIVIGIPPAEVP